MQNAEHAALRVIEILMIMAVCAGGGYKIWRAHRKEFRKLPGVLFGRIKRRVGSMFKNLRETWPTYFFYALLLVGIVFAIREGNEPKQDYNSCLEECLEEYLYKDDAEDVIRQCRIECE